MAITPGQLPEAEGIYQQILHAAPNEPDALHLLGVIAHQGKKYKSAVEFITKALAVRPNFAVAYNNLGNALHKLNKLDEAAENYQKAVAIVPDYADAHYNLGIVLKELNKLDEAVASYQKAIDIKPDYAEAYNNRGNVLKAQGKLDDAVASYHKALAIKPDYADGELNLIETLTIHNANTESTHPIIKTDQALRKITLIYENSKIISDSKIIDWYSACSKLLKDNQINISYPLSQTFRRNTIDLNCDRHKSIFEDHNVIPEYCFGCYKVQIEPRTVLELFKLWG